MGLPVLQKAFTEAVVIMALRCVLLFTLVVVFASVDIVSADGDKFSGKDCSSDDHCVSVISYCDNSVEGSVGSKLIGKLSNTLAAAAGECRIVWWFGPLMAILIISILCTIICSCLCCAFCPLYHLGKCLRPSEA